jgi:hypothetical protein
MRLKRTALAALAATTVCGAAYGAQMTIYKQPQFSGDRVTVNNGARDLAPLGVTDQASSLVVGGGRWEACTQPDFNGDCRTLEPGEYATLDPVLNHRIESVRVLEQQARGRDRGRYAREREGFRDEGRAYEPRDDGGWADSNRERQRGGDAWRP